MDSADKLMIVWAATVRNKTEPEYTFTSDGLSFDPSQLLLPTPHPVDDYYDYNIATDGYGSWMVAMLKKDSASIVASVSQDDGGNFGQIIPVSPSNNHTYMRPSAAANDDGVFTVVYADIALDNDIFWRSTTNPDRVGRST